MLRSLNSFSLRRERSPVGSYPESPRHGDRTEALQGRNEVTSWQIIITAGGAVASMILAVFGSSWLNQQATDPAIRVD